MILLESHSHNEDTPRIPSTVTDAIAGDPQALQEVLRTVGPRVLRAVRGVLGANAPEVEDVVQESMVALLDALPRYRAEASLPQYAARIAVRSALGARRKQRRRRERLQLFQREKADSPSRPSDSVDDVRRRALFRELLGELPENQAEALVLRVVLGYSLDEVARVTAVPANTVRSRVRLAKEALRHRIEKRPALASLREGRP